MRTLALICAALLSCVALAGTRLLVTRGTPISGTITSGTTIFGSTGTLSGTTYSGPANWFAPATTSIGSGYWLKVVKTTCSGASSISGITDSTFTQLSASITLSATGGAGSCNANWSISTASGGTPVVASGTLSVNNTI